MYLSKLQIVFLQLIRVDARSASNKSTDLHNTLLALVSSSARRLDFLGLIGKLGICRYRLGCSALDLLHSSLEKLLSSNLVGSGFSSNFEILIWRLSLCQAWKAMDWIPKLTISKVKVDQAWLLSIKWMVNDISELSKE